MDHSNLWAENITVSVSCEPYTFGVPDEGRKREILGVEKASQGR